MNSPRLITKAYLLLYFDALLLLDMSLLLVLHITKRVLQNVIRSLIVLQRYLTLLSLTNNTYIPSQLSVDYFIFLMDYENINMRPNSRSYYNMPRNPSSTNPPQNYGSSLNSSYTPRASTPPKTTLKYTGPIAHASKEPDFKPQHRVIVKVYEDLDVF